LRSRHLYVPNLATRAPLVNISSNHMLSDSALLMCRALHAILWLCLTGVMLTRPLHAAPPTGSDPNSEIGRWFQSLQNSKGEICCSIADCRRPYAWRQTGRGYQVQEGNGAPWLDVPPENILRRENPLGDAIACIVGGRVRCFVPPSDI
jgi:hypothetical protein